jgi:hypothetical protein
MRSSVGAPMDAADELRGEARLGSDARGAKQEVTDSREPSAKAEVLVLA